jgi:hypothetical protein
MRQAISRYIRIVSAASLALLCAAPAFAEEKVGILPDDWQLTGNFGVGYSEGDYGTPVNTNVTLGLGSVSLGVDDFKFSVSVPYMHIDGRGLLLFDASGNPIVIARRSVGPTDVRTGWGDLNLSASYTIPSVILDGFELRLSGVAKLPTASSRRRLSTGEADVGVSVDVSRQFGAWQPFVTIGYLDVGKPAGLGLNDTTSVSAGTSVELSDNLVLIGSYDFDSADGPQVADAQSLFGSLSWVAPHGITLTGYGTAGLSSGSPDMSIGALVSYAVN